MPAMTLKEYQAFQLKHDQQYHPEILYLGVARHMNHVALHLVKYLSRFFSYEPHDPEYRQALVDSYIMVVTAANLLSIDLSQTLGEAASATSDQPSFKKAFILLLGDLAKACEATDHQEDFPIRKTWARVVTALFELLSMEAKQLRLEIIHDATIRLQAVEGRHGLSNIFQANG